MQKRESLRKGEIGEADERRHQVGRHGRWSHGTHFSDRGDALSAVAEKGKDAGVSVLWADDQGAVEHRCIRQNSRGKPTRGLRRK